MSDTKREIYIRLLRDLYEAFFSEDAIRDMLELLKEESEQKKGRWIEVDDDLISGRCSICGWEAHLYEDDVVGMSYCPNCGADMRGEQDGRFNQQTGGN